jgi:MtfA peptidase
MLFIVLLALIFFGIYLAKPKAKNNVDTGNTAVFVNDSILTDNIAFFRALDKTKRQQFETEVKEFLAAVKITGVDTAVENLDRVLVAASAVIPVFAFPEWKYTNLKEVLLYSDSFNNSFQTEGGNDRNIMGMVGSGYMEGKMLLPNMLWSRGLKTAVTKTIPPFMSLYILLIKPMVIRMAYQSNYWISNLLFPGWI